MYCFISLSFLSWPRFAFGWSSKHLNRSPTNDNPARAQHLPTEKLRRKPPKRQHSYPDDINEHAVTEAEPAGPIEIHVHHTRRPHASSQAHQPQSIPQAEPLPHGVPTVVEEEGGQEGRATAKPGLGAKLLESGFKLSACTGRKKALCIGINYTNTAHELSGCINDAEAVRKFLMSYHRFRHEDIVLLTDDGNDERTQPTRQNILDAMRWLVKDAHEDDSLFFHYSGHGAQTRDKKGDEMDGFDEVIYPLDYKSAGRLVDDEMHAVMVNELPMGCRLTALFDSCHSGSVLDLPYRYHSDGRLKSSQVSRKAKEGRGSTADVILWSGCQDDNTSMGTQRNGIAVGAMSYAFITTLRQNQNHTFESLLREVRRLLRDKYNQKPQLSSSHQIDTEMKFII